MAKYHVAEKFTSINGEGTKAGQLAVFIRFAGCNLRCSYCDTSWANEEDVPSEQMTETEIIRYIRDTGIRNVTLTGGEPLLQKEIGLLLERLSKEEGLFVEIETNGSVSLAPYQDWKNRPSFTMDYKLPGSGMEDAMCLQNKEYLQPQDTVKFVMDSREDFLRAISVMNEWGLRGRCHIYFSTVFGEITPAQVVEWMKEYRLNDVNLQLQLHKYIWEPSARGK